MAGSRAGAAKLLSPKLRAQSALYRMVKVRMAAEYIYKKVSREMKEGKIAK